MLTFRQAATWVVTFCVAAVAMLVVGAAEARVLVVSDRGDHQPGPCSAADCTLREAVIAANLRPGGDVIELPSRRRYELAIASTGEDAALDGDLDITSGPLKMTHPGSGRATIDANRTDRIFDIGAARTRLRKLTIRGGRAHPTDAGGDGGGIMAGDLGDAPVTIVRSRVIDNEAPVVDGNGGGIDTDIAGLLRVVHSTVARNDAGGDGGGISGSVEGPVRIERSTIVRNEAGEGAGLMAVGPPAIVSASTIAYNRAVGGGDGEVGDGAGIYVDDQGVLLIRNSTVSGNRAINSGGGIFGEEGGRARINAATIARNHADVDATGGGVGGGVQLDGAAFEVANSMLVLNAGGGSPSDCGGATFAGIDAPNLITTTDGGCGPGEEIVVANPRIGPLTDNGGPTETIALRRVSPAVGAADPGSSPPRDQRGRKRRNPDIGAYERR